MESESGVMPGGVQAGRADAQRRLELREPGKGMESPWASYMGGGH